MKETKHTPITMRFNKEKGTHFICSAIRFVFFFFLNSIPNYLKSTNHHHHHIGSKLPVNIFAWHSFSASKHTKSKHRTIDSLSFQYQIVDFILFCFVVIFFSFIY